MEPTPVIPDVASTAKPRVTSTRVLRPLGPTTLTCVGCKKLTAKWFIVHPRYGQENICSLCFFYDSGWLEAPESKVSLERVANVIALRHGKSLAREDGKLTARDADDVLGAITLHERFSIITQRRS